MDLYFLIIFIIAFFAIGFLNRYLNYYLYIRDVISVDNAFIWFCPIFNLIPLVAYIHMILKYKNLNFYNTKKKWKKKKIEYQNKLREKQMKEHKEVDPLGEETWEN
jgi:hypothetical protein